MGIWYDGLDDWGATLMESIFGISVDRIGPNRIVKPGLKDDVGTGHKDGIWNSMIYT